MKITDLINNQIKRYLDNFIPGLVFTIFAFTLIATILPDIGGFSLENLLYDFRMTYKMYNSQTVNQDKKIHVILIDDNAMSNDKRLKDSGPISKSYLADLINKVIDQKPKVIGIDFFLNSISSNPTDDVELQKAIDRAIKNKIPIVYVAAIIESAYKGTEVLNPQKIFYKENNDLTTLGHPYFVFNKVDNTVRSLELIKGNDVIIPAFGLRMAELFTGEQYDLMGSYLIDFSTPLKEVYNLYSSYDILSKPNSNDIDLKNKVVIIGAGYEKAPDKYFTPITGRFGRDILLSGPEIHAYVVYNIINNKKLSAPTHTTLIIVITLLLFLTIFIIFQKFKIKEMYFILLSIVLISVYSLYYFDKVTVTLVRPVGLWIILSLLFWENNDHILSGWLYIKRKILRKKETTTPKTAEEGEIAHE